MTNKDIIRTGIGNFSKEKFNSLINLRAAALREIRKTLENNGYTEVSTSSLVNIAGSCEDQYKSFWLDFYDRKAYLSQSAQLQLESIVIRLRRKVFSVNSSFRSENYEDPEKQGRLLSEFTLIEPEAPYEGHSKHAFRNLTSLIEDVVKSSLDRILNKCLYDIEILGGDLDHLKEAAKSKFMTITYDEALELLPDRKRGRNADLGITEEREILAHFNNLPVFVTHFPPEIKFFNMKRTPDGSKVYSADLLLPNLGETVGGGLREEDGVKIKEFLLSSDVGKFLEERDIDPEATFGPYLRLFDNEKAPLCGGFGIGFERFVAFLTGSTDILETVSFRTLQPGV